MAETRYAFTPPRNAMLRWLTDPDSQLSPQAGAVLLGELWASQKAVFAGIANALIVKVAALCMHCGSIFALFIAADLALILARVTALNRLVSSASRGLSAPSDRYLVMAISWWALQGVMAFGHQVGDNMLRAVAERLKSAIRTGDFVSRLGGDEFVIVAPGMAPADGAGYANAVI